MSFEKQVKINAVNVPRYTPSTFTGDVLVLPVFYGQYGLTLIDDTVYVVRQWDDVPTEIWDWKVVPSRDALYRLIHQAHSRMVNAQYRKAVAKSIGAGLVWNGTIIDNRQYMQGFIEQLAVYCWLDESVENWALPRVGPFRPVYYRLDEEPSLTMYPLGGSK